MDGGPPPCGRERVLSLDRGCRAPLILEGVVMRRPLGMKCVVHCRFGRGSPWEAATSGEEARAGKGHAHKGRWQGGSGAQSQILLILFC